MSTALEIFKPLHTKTSRDYLGRMLDRKVHCMQVAKQYDSQFWDGERRFGYGGYQYDGRWEPVARQLIDIYALPKNASILDIGCGKGYLLYEFQKLLPEARLVGFDASRYAIVNAKKEIADSLFVHRAEEKLPFQDDEFDLALSLMTLHNLSVFDLQKALAEMERVSKNKFLTVESYRNEQELFHLQCWALTCESFFRPEEWEWLFHQFNYRGDYEFIYFE